MTTRVPSDDVLLSALSRRRGGEVALTPSGVAMRLDLPRKSVPDIERALDRLVSGGRLLRVRGRRYALPDALGETIGRFDRHPIGYGFVIPDDPGEKDLFIPPHAQGDALHRDIVAVVVVDVKPDGRREGRIVGVVERRGERVVGLYHRAHAGGGIVEPLDSGSSFEVRVAKDAAMGAQPGELVTVRVDRHPENGIAKGTIIERLGQPDDPGADVAAVMRRYGLAEEFPDDVLRAAERLPAASDGWDLEGREDFRGQIVVTIDGADARDFDDAISVDAIEGGGYRLFVHIADVDAFVAEGGAIDREAMRRGTSVYFPGHVVPMLPPRLSDDLCSLRPHVERLTHGVAIDFDARGRPQARRFFDGIIASRARLTYDEVSALLEDADQDLRARLGDVASMLDRAAVLAKLLIEDRGRRGAIDFEMAETYVTLDDRGATTAILRRERRLAHRLIEEFMIAANEAVATELVEAREPAIHRVHERPDAGRIARLAEFIAPLGYGVPEPFHAIEPEDLAAIVERSRGLPEAPFINRVVLRSLALARYDVVSLGHFGLALSRYLHFTSPIRRYPDLVAHRALRRRRAPVRDAAGDRRERRVELAGVAMECSRLEREAEAAEREAVAWKVARLMARHVGEVFEGVVVEVAPWGLGIALDDPAVEATVPVARLGPEFFRFDPRKQTLHGTQSTKLFRLGLRLRVLVDRVDVLHHTIELAISEEDMAPPESRRRRSGRREEAGRKPKSRRIGGGRSTGGSGRPGRRK